MIDIPSKFDLMGTTWYVIKDDARFDREDNHLAFCDAVMHQIVIRLMYKGDSLSPDQINQSFYHELTHAILTTLNEDKLNNNEKFVDTFGGLLNQFNKTRSNEL